MENLPPLAELLPFIITLIGAGVVAGFLAGLFGIGGGAVLVPVFFEMLGIMHVDNAIRMHLAVGTSLAIIVPTSLQSFRKHYAKGAVDSVYLKHIAPMVLAGVISAAIVTAFISGVGLRIIFAVMAGVIGIKFLFAKDHWKLGTEIPSNPLRSIVGWAIGFFSTFMGIGGGVFNNTFMTLYGRKILQAIATSSGVGVLISLPGMLGYIWSGWGAAGLPPFSIGFVNLLMVAMVIPITLMVAPLGVKVAHTVSKRHLELGFGIFLLIVAGRFIVSIV